MINGISTAVVAVTVLHGIPLAASVLLAQADQAGQQLPQVAAGLSNMTAGGVLIWYLWYTQSRSMPKATADFLSSMEKQTAMYTAAQADARVQFGEVIERERAYHNEQMELLRARVHGMSDNMMQANMKAYEIMQQTATAVCRLEEIIKQVGKAA